MSLSQLLLTTTTNPLLPCVEASTPPPSTSVGMLFACLSIVIVLAAMFFVFMRAHKKEYAVAVLPLVITPLMHICSGVIARWLDGILPLTWVELRVALDLIAALISCLLIGFSSRSIAVRRSRNVFLIFCSGFIIILTLALIINILSAYRL